eukprot:31790-Pyramimonas_sp.AAC.2
MAARYLHRGGGVHTRSRGGSEGKKRSIAHAREPQNRDDKVKNTRGVFKVCCTSGDPRRTPS